MSSTEKASEQLCRTCNYKFTDREDQVLHYKLDWHLYNVKQCLRSTAPISEDEFDQRCDSDMSSLSGSDSEDDDEGFDEILTSQFLDDTPELTNAVVCSPYVIVRFNDGFYKCLYSLLFSPRSEITDQILSETLTHITSLTPQNVLEYKGAIAVFLYSAQHFAGAVYEDGKLLLHKTYHRYTVRAKQGTVQGIRDGKGNAPKSFGASLRRYNQIALFNDIEKLMVDWSETLNGCNVIFHRTAVHSRHVLDKLKDKIGENKTKIRTIPFTTYRPTLKETERVYRLLTKINKAFQNEFEDAKAAKAISQTPNPSQSTVTPHQSQPSNSRSIPNSHIKQRPEKPKPVPVQVEQVTPVQPQFYEEQDNVYFKLLQSIKSQNFETFTTLLDSEQKTMRINQPLDCDNTLLHHCASANSPSFVSHLLHRGANPEHQNKQNNTPYDVSQNVQVRNEFRRYMAKFPEKWDYRAAKIPSPLTAEMEEEQAKKRQEKKKAQRAAKNTRDKQKKAAKKEGEKREEEKLMAEAQKLRLRQLTPRERCLLAAEARLAAGAGGRGCVSGKCANCETGLDGLVPFERLEYKYCSVNCVREHKDKL